MYERVREHLQGFTEALRLPLRPRIGGCRISAELGQGSSLAQKYHSSISVDVP